MASGDEILQLAPEVWCLGQHKGGRVHAFLLDDGGELTLVDTLFDTDGAKILGQIEAIGRKPEDLKHIVITHGHRSHVGGMAALHAATGAPVYSHEWEADILSGDREAQRISMLPHKPYRTWFPIQFGLATGQGRQPPCEVEHFIAGGDQVGPLHVIDASGHSPGHLAFLWPEQNLLIAGDTVCTWPSFDAGWPALNLNLRKHHQALRRLAETEADILGVGHGSPIQGGGHARVRSLVDALAK
jgi:glyoxylase-like metal-dependent hydrolase (beta-lactamase superfamily II)